MTVLVMLAGSVTDTSGIRLMLLAFVLIAVVLLLTGSVLALLTLRNQRRATRIALEQLESKKV
jgi:hypothetical protein